jgi:hypothetical protein
LSSFFSGKDTKKIAPFGAISLDSAVVPPVIVFIGVIPLTKVRIWIRQLVRFIRHRLHDSGVFFELGGIGREWQDHGGGGVGDESRSLAAGKE